MSVIFAFEGHLGQHPYAFEAHLEEGTTGVFGPSGAGKSSLLHLIAGLQRPQRGVLIVDGQTLCDTDARVWTPSHRRRIGVVFQESRLFPHLSVRENLVFGARLLGGVAQRFSFEQVATWLELAELLEKPATALSGGEAQRVALGRALLASPRLLLLDEPLASLDRGNKKRILALLRRIQAESGLTMLHVSHDLGELLQLTSQLLVVDQGRVHAHQPFLELVPQPRILALIHDLGLLNVLPMEVVARDAEGGTTRLRPEVSPDAPTWVGPSESSGAQRLHCALRPEDIALVRESIQGSSIQNQIPGTLVHLVASDHRFLVVVDVGVKLLAEVTGHAVQELGLEPGQRIHCLFKAQAVRYL